MPKIITDQQILDAALEVIARQGYAGATTREIAAVAGINEVTLFRRFENKQKLLTAAVEQEAEIFAAASIKYTGDVQADLEHVVRFYQGLARKRGRVIGMLLSEIPRQPELLDVLKTPLAIIANIANMLQRYQQEGDLVAEPPMQAFIALIGPIFMGGVLGTIQPSAFNVPFDAPAYVQRFLKGRKAAGG